MALKTLKTRLSGSSLSRVPTLTATAGQTEMPSGRAWMERRHRIALAHGYKCSCCGCVWQSNRDQIDHEVPRAEGGSNEDSNLRPLCNDCHKAKTAQENSKRFKRG